MRRSLMARVIRKQQTKCYIEEIILELDRKGEIKLKCLAGEVMDSK